MPSKRSNPVTGKKRKVSVKEPNLVDELAKTQEADDESEDDFKRAARNLMEASNKRHENRRAKLGQDLEKVTEDLGRDIKEAYEKKHQEKKQLLKQKLQELRDLMQERMEVEEKVVTEIDALEKSTMQMNKEIMAAMQGRKLELDSLVLDKEQPAREEKTAKEEQAEKE